MGDLADEVVESGYAEQCERDAEAYAAIRAMEILESKTSRVFDITKNRMVRFHGTTWDFLMRDKWGDGYDWTVISGHHSLAEAIIAAAEYKGPMPEGT